MASVSQILSFLPSFMTGGSKTLDDDVIDRWNHHVTTTMFVIMSVSVTALQHLGSPISCAIPEDIKQFDKYADNVCWISNTYYLDSSEDIPRVTPEDKLINYYQWVSLFLLFQALLFYAPSAVWDFMYPKCGVDLSGILATAQGIKVFDKSTDEPMDFMVRQINKYLDHYPKAVTRGRGHSVLRYLKRLGRKQGNFLMILYLFTKILYLLNSILQFWVLSKFLSTEFHLYGWDVMKSWIANENYPPSIAFPRQTLCDFEVRRLGNKIHEHTIQCVLPINFYNEKVFLIVWFWLVLTIVLNAGSLITWCFRFCGCFSKRFVKHYFKINKATEDDYTKKKYKAFIERYLRQDGVFILRLLKVNVNGMIVSEVVGKLLAMSKKNNPEFYGSDATEPRPNGNGHFDPPHLGSGRFDPHREESSFV